MFLLALLPWVALLLWLLLGKRRRVNVSFLELWKGPVSGPTARRRIGMPPLALVAALAALLLMILAAARPGIPHTTSAADVPVIVVVDRGITMSMGKPPRSAALVEEIRPVIREQFGKEEVKYVYLPDRQAGSLTAIDTRGMLETAVREQLEANPASPVIVVSDQDLEFEDKRVVRVGPKGSAANISIAHAAARISPVGQVQLRLRNQSSQSKTTLRVLCDGRETARQEVELPAINQTGDHFLPIDAAAKVIRVEVDANDDFAGDNAAFLVRRGSWPAVEVRTPVYAELQRLVENYSKLRPASDQSKRVGIVSTQEAGASPQIIFAKPGPAANGKASVSDHPITAALEKVDWEVLGRDGVSEPAGDGWKAVVRISDKTAIAVRETPARQVWIGLSTQKLATSPEFVILWTNIFDWVGGGEEEFVSQTTSQLGTEWNAVEPLPAGLPPGWWPGIYRRSDGALLAVNAPDVELPKNAQTSDWRSRLAAVAGEYRAATATRWLTIPLLISALVLMVVATATWRGGLKKNAPQPRAYARSTSGAIDAM